MRSLKGMGLFVLATQALLLAGWCQCAYKMVKCNWEPVGKAEVIYTAGTFTGLGVIIGWFNIEDK